MVAVVVVVVVVAAAAAAVVVVVGAVWLSLRWWRRTCQPVYRRLQPFTTPWPPSLLLPAGGVRAFL